MKSISEIRQNIGASLREVEHFRKDKLAAIKSGRRLNVIPIILLIVAAVSLVGSMIPIAIGAGVISLIAFAIIYFWKIAPHHNAYKSHYKDKVLSAFVNAVYPKTTFRANDKVASHKFTASGLFGSYDDYYGEDYFRGTTEDGQKFEFSEVRATRTTRDSDGDTNTTTVFDGVLFVLEAKTTATTDVRVLPDTAEKSFGGIGKFIQKNLGSLFQKGSMVYLKEHPEFEKEFVVYAQSEEEARRILTPTMIGAIYNLKYKWDRPLRVSFVGTNVYIALSTSQNYFKADVNKSVLEDALLKELYDELALCFAVVEDMSGIKKGEKAADEDENWNNDAYDHLTDSSNPFLM